MSSADSRAGILGDCGGAGPPGRCRVESVMAADLEVSSTRGQPSKQAPGGKIMKIDEHYTDFWPLFLYLQTIRVSLFWFNMDVLDVQSSHISIRTN